MSHLPAKSVGGRLAAGLTVVQAVVEQDGFAVSGDYPWRSVGDAHLARRLGGIAERRVTLAICIG